ncbi:F-actin-monooxygenase Mical isoform X1 [Neodiprion fabricii]|uniref:F-actin-monooxygenase Mical isoform X1 n=1 Tax=Neodiprion fabricii TaxID=2872261 RepID=UPI001ED94BC9|nr:F-actin-monooxygenase Mical isoform X1 [Neodiprion fabricii]XP_046409939.1 F-actin-monooxygenase Mical isoform X1 [Neodiprion fabricii]XP_046409940.1 F-actin-monooxygenase Mical isoform X1 [Neodiprion fabricii]XP_046409941.1 F-actin-monooxygenase Mical isoform X1 [Neodiprion fabricii]
MEHQLGRKQIASPEVALASEVFDQFCNASTLKSILGHFRHLCDLLKLKPNTFNQFYPKLKSKLRSWKAQALWKKFDQRASHKCYNRGKACPNTRVLIIGGGPCGLRSAIEAQLLGAKVVVVEKRDRVTRNNVLHLWPFVIQDLRSLGAKKFFGKFCAGAIDHISIRQLQCILLKVALVLGVEFHENVSFDALVPPPENQEESKIGWRAKTSPADHPVSQYEFNVLLGADGKRNTLEGFKRKEFRGKLAIAITANFINKKTEAEARVEEISGVAFIFNQKFFKELYQVTGIDLENIVYYKDDTHYFVMTAKKHSLIDKGVILQDHADTAKLLAMENVNREALMQYATEAAEFSTEYQMTNMEFAVNHYGQPDVAMFDFTSMYAAENASRVLEQKGHRLLMILVGDSLLEPFWPTGSGCARGFLSSLDACWAIKGWSTMTPLEVLAERESIYRLLGQTTPENLNRDYAAYTLDPHTRYPNLNPRLVTPIQVRGLLDTDDPDNIEQPSMQPAVDIPKKRRRRDLGTDSQVHPDVLLHWLRKQVALYNTVHIADMSSSFKDGLAICAIIHRYRPDLIDFHSLKSEDVEKNNQLAFDILEKELGISPVMTADEIASCDVPDKLDMFSYLTQIYETFRGEIPHIKHPKLEPETEDRPTFTKQLKQLTPEQRAQLLGRITKQDGTSRTRHSRSRHGNEYGQSTTEKKVDSLSRRSRKRRSTDKMGATTEERLKRLEDIEKNRSERMMKRQYLRKMANQQFYKSMQMLQANAKRDKDEPFEDYSIFLYRQTAPDFKDRVKELEQKILYPDRDPKVGGGPQRGAADEEFSGRIKNIEDKLKGTAPTEKKPRDLLRAIGKIERSDWNVKEIEKKIEENKMGRGARQQKVERVPKWSREQFLARQIKMEKKGRDPNDSDSKYADLDNTLKFIDKKIKEGNVLGHNKVSAMAEQFSNKNQEAEQKVQRSNSKAALVLPAQGGSEMCHFCNKRVYLMERLSAEGKFFHRGCFRCEYCSTSLRIGSHMFDREKAGGRFYCTQHFGLSGTMKARVEKKKISLIDKENIPNLSPSMKTPEKPKTPLEGVVGLDLLDRGQTPERIEFENLAGLSDAEEAQSQMDEDEWTDRNFGASTAEMGSSDEMSCISDSDDDNEVYEEALDQPLTTEGTLELAKKWTLRYSHPHASGQHSDSGSNEYEDYTTEDDESGTATEDEDDERARKLRKQEVWLEDRPHGSETDTGSDTEVASDDDSAEESDENSATEISTDSEFEHDGTTPTQHEIPEITINDAFVRKTRGNYVEPITVQVRSHVISPVNGNLKENKGTGVQLEFSKINANKEFGVGANQAKSYIVQSSPKIASPSPLVNPRKGDYLLNRTHSTEGIASKLSLELKKRYLLGSSALTGSVMKSGSTSNVDTKLRSFTDIISQHQKLLNPAPEPSPTMQAFLQGTNKLRSSNIQLSPLSPSTVLNSSPFKGASPVQSPKILSDIELNKSADTSDVSKVPLPDLIKETNIMKSKTDPNIVRKDSQNIPDRKIIEQIVMTEVPKTVVHANEDLMTNLCKKSDRNIEDGDPAYENIECRPRSPLHETSIIVPNVDWRQNNKEDCKETETSDDSEMDSDSLSCSGTEFEELLGAVEHAATNLSPPRLQIHSTSGELLLDEETGKEKQLEAGVSFEPDSIECVRTDERGAVNPLVSKLFETHSFRNVKIPERDEGLNNNLSYLDPKDGGKNTLSNCSSPTSARSGASSEHDDSEENDITTAALTETEFSEWARDGEGLVSEDLRDVEFNINPEFITTRSNRIHKHVSVPHDTVSARIAREEDLTDLDSDCNRKSTEIELPINQTSELLANGENIDFMDTDNESFLDDSLQDATNTTLLKNRGYIEFVNIKETTPIQISHICSSEAPIAETEYDHELGSDDDQYKDENVIEINPITMNDIKDRLNSTSNKNVKLETYHSPASEQNETPEECVKKEVFQSMEDDSLLVAEPAEDTTTSEIITVLASPINPHPSTALMKTESNDNEPLKQVSPSHDGNNPDYLEYVKRLQSRIAEFSNVKDSIDVRKGRRKNSKCSGHLRSQEMIAEEVKIQEAQGNNSFNSPATSRKLEEITRERSKQKYLIQDILMDKLQAQKLKSAEKKAKRAARTFSFSPGTIVSPAKPLNVLESSPVPLKFMPTSTRTPTNSPVHTTFAEAKKALDLETPVMCITPKSTVEQLNFETLEKQTGREAFTQKFLNSEKSVAQRSESGVSEAPQTTSNVYSSEFVTPTAPPRIKHEEAKRTAEKARQDARARARLKSDEDLGLSPEDRIKQLRMKVPRRQLSVEDNRGANEEVMPEVRTRHYSFGSLSPGKKLQTSKSTDNVKVFTKKVNTETKVSGNAKSMDELLQSSEAKCENDAIVSKRDKKKSKDPERRKSIIQAVSDFFKKKETSVSPPNQRDKFSRFRLPSKLRDKGKLYKSYSDGSDLDKESFHKLDNRPKSVCEGMLMGSFLDGSPPLVPPPPVHYALPTSQLSDDTLSEEDSKTTALSMSQTHRVSLPEDSCHSMPRKEKTAKRQARQTQLKRLRMAQEIQRKLEETEVKQRELESRGVSVEKALRGEGECMDREEVDLLREWFDLMRERTELRRYEKELLVRAQELQLEDRHERLEQELRERLADDDGGKTSDDVKKEGEILTEMLEIVAKRDSLIVLLEEERQRWRRPSCPTLTAPATATVTSNGIKTKTVIWKLKCWLKD